MNIRERRVTFHTNTGEKILRLPATENKVSIGDDISKRDLRLERVEMSSQFCFLWQTIFIRIFTNSVCIKRTHRPGCTALEKYTLSKIKNLLGYKIFCRLRKPLLARCAIFKNGEIHFFVMKIYSYSYIVLERTRKQCTTI